MYNYSRSGDFVALHKKPAGCTGGTIQIMETLPAAPPSIFLSQAARTGTQSQAGALAKRILCKFFCILYMSVI